MNKLDALKQSIIRFMTISGFIILAAYLLYGKRIFYFNYSQSEFFQSGITIGIAFTAFRDKKYRQGIGALILWYILLNGVSHTEVLWFFIQLAMYITIISLGVYYSIAICRKPFINNKFFRIATPIVVIGVSNALISIVIVLIHVWYNIKNILYLPEEVILNLKYGALLGLFLGMSNEILEEYIFPKLSKQKITSEQR
ncbi:MAG TPA: hypothetical protein VMU30_07655 [Bacteroidota bacterium]|nr:hypothetical protein [Bacteroidota bacterium]